MRCEPLEDRALLAVGSAVTTTDFGTLTAGRVFQGGDEVSEALNAVKTHRYTFTTTSRMDFSAQLNVHPDFFGEINDGYMYLEPDSDNPSFDVTEFSSSDGKATITRTLSPGSYVLGVDTNVAEDFVYDLALGLDAAPGAFFDPSSSLLDFTTDGVEVGALRAAETQTFSDFIGYLNTSQNAASDLVDIYHFSAPAAGSVAFTLDQIVADEAGGLLGENVALYRDFDHDGIYAANELVTSRTGITSSGTATGNVSVGDYALVVSGRVGTGSAVAGGSNYRLRFTYTPPDRAGGTLAAAKDLGTVGGAEVPFLDYMSGGDTDVYRFTTLAGGPFEFSGRISGPATLAGATLALVRDANGNGTIDSGETLASDSVAAGQADISALLTIPGTYFVRVQPGSAGADGPYTLSIASTNTDRGGNAFATATNISNLFGKVKIADFVSNTDPVDFYKFTLTDSATFTARLGSTASGTDAVLALYQDLDNDGVQDKGEELTRSDVAGNGAESLSRSLPAGTYIVGVFAKTGSPAYELTMIEDVASFIPTIGKVLALDGPDGQVIDYVGPEDTTDYYRLTVTSPVQINAFVSLLGDTVRVAVIRDVNHNGLVDPGESLSSTTLTSSAATAANHVSVNLPVADPYFLRVSHGGTVGTNYGLVLATAPIDNAGNTLARARDVGVLTTSSQNFSDFVGDGRISATNDVDDFYKFTLGNRGPYEFIGQVPFTTGQIITQLIRDANDNGAIDSGEVIATTVSPVANVPPAPIGTVLTLPGNYYYHVLRFTGEAAYIASLQAVPLDSAGNTIGTARVLSAPTVTEFVGSLDPDDFFRFTTTAPGEVTARISAAASQGVGVEIVRDANSNGLIDDGESLGSTIGTTALNDALFGVQIPEAGTYFAHVVGNTAASGYTLTVVVDSQTPFNGVPFVVDPTVPAGVTIQAEDFDRGGEGVAYHDSTPATNLGGVYRPLEGVDLFSTADSVGGFKIDSTAPGEFTEYTINVLGTGSYNMAFRVGSQGAGARFHAEIDGVSVTGGRDVPGNLPADGFATVQVSNVSLSSGTHVLRLVIDQVNTTGPAGGGAFNFITIAPATGTFELAAPATARVNELVPLSLGWTVPAGSWHLLKTIDLRIRDNSGVALWLRIDLVHQTAQLFNEHSGKFGPAKKIGSPGKLTNGNVQLDTSLIRIVGDGPIAPSVTIKLGVRFLRSSAGRTYTVEAAASNVFGFQQTFDTAGTLRVS